MFKKGDEVVITVSFTEKKYKAIVKGDRSEFGRYAVETEDFGINFAYKHEMVHDTKLHRFLLGVDTAQEEEVDEV